MSTRNQRNSGYRAPEEQWVKRIRRTEDQRNSEYRGPEQRRTRGPEDQRTRGPEDQRTRGTVSTEDQWNRGYNQTDKKGLLNAFTVNDPDIVSKCPAVTGQGDMGVP